MYIVSQTEVDISGGNLSEQWPGLQSLCSRVVMVLSRSFLTNQWEQVHWLLGITYNIYNSHVSD